LNNFSFRLKRKNVAVSGAAGGDHSMHRFMKAENHVEEGN
jgi:hypothetical protein